MPSRSRLIAFAALLLPVLLAGVPIATASPGAGTVDARNLGSEPLRRVIVTWRNGPGAVPAADRRDRLVEAVPGIRHAASVSEDAAAYWLPDAPVGRAAMADLTALAGVRGVAEVAPDLHLTTNLQPDDELYSDYQEALFGTYGIDAEAAWDLTQGDGAVTVGIIDTGITTHAEFSGRVVPGYDFISDSRVANDGNGRDSNPADPGDWITSAEHSSGYFAGCPTTRSSWHGTHVTGIAAAAGDNGVGVAGIAWKTSILPVRVLGKCGGWMSDIAAGIRWAAGGTVTGVAANAHPAGVINLSLSGPGECDTYAQAAIDAAIHLGTTVVVAAGNDTSDVSGYSPANCDGVISVAATTELGQRASFSNYGAGVTLAAPGVDITSTYNLGTRSPGDETYALLSGTSMAAPHVTGVVALALAEDPTLTPDAIRSLLIANVGAPAPTSPPGCQCGAGIVDAGAVVAAASAGPTPTPAPTPEPTPDPSALPDITAPAVMAFAASGATVVNDAALGFDLEFDEPVRNLEPADLSVAGTADDCFVDVPDGPALQYTVLVMGCTEGTVSLSLAADSVEDGFGNPGPAAIATTNSLLVDRTGPKVSAPRVALRTGVSLTGSRLPVHVSWSGSDQGGAGVASYEVLRTGNGGSTWVFVAGGLTSSAVNTTLPSSGTWVYLVDAVDNAGNLGDAGFGASLKPRLVQQSSGAISYSGTWKKATSSSYSGGSANYATKAGASAKYRFTGRSIAFVSRTSSARGKVKIYIGSTRVATIDLGKGGSAYRRVAWQHTWSSRVTKTVKIVVVGTSGRPRVDLDAFEVLG